LVQRLKVPVKGLPPDPGPSSGRKTLTDGIEVFPKQDQIPAAEFGNAIRGPLGVHRAVGKRYWFYGADYTLEAQVAYLTRLRRITAEEMSGFVCGLRVPEEASNVAKPIRRHYFSGNPGSREFSILEHVSGEKRKTGRNYFTRCPSCAQQGRDKSGDNLAISIADPRKYKCWAGCTKQDIRAALGYPIRSRQGLSA
jgi:hypothetical protein